jgi:integrator complex subunit 3
MAFQLLFGHFGKHGQDDDSNDDIVVSFMRDRFSDVIMIGRDLVRVLQQVAKIPQFAALWTDIQMSPKNLSPSFAGISQLMRTRTSRRFTLEMEKKLVFLTLQVNIGSFRVRCYLNSCLNEVS